MRDGWEEIDFVPAGNRKRYQIDGSQYERVTTLVNEGLPKPFLIPWAAKMAAETAVYDQDEWRDLELDEAVAHIKSAHTRVRDKAGAKGSAVHAYAEARILGRPIDPEYASMISGEEADRDVKRMTLHVDEIINDVFTPDLWEHTEVACYSETIGYAGTFDGIIRLGPGRIVDGVPDLIAQLLMSMGLDPMIMHRVLVDWKTSKSLGGGFALQLSAYRFSDFFIYPVHEIEGKAYRERNDPYALADVALLISVRPEKWAIHPVGVTGETFAGFVSVTQAARWNRGADRAVRKVPILSSQTRKRS